MISAASSWPSMSRTSVMATRAPSRASIRQVARPMPRAPPVIRTVLSWSRFMEKWVGLYDRTPSSFRLGAAWPSLRTDCPRSGRRGRGGWGTAGLELLDLLAQMPHLADQLVNLGLL